MFSCIISENVPALKDVWLVGDEFLRENCNGLVTLKTAARINKRDPPYLHNHYNVTAYYINSSFLIRSALTRIVNAVIEGINAKDHLPKYVFVIPDKDILQAMKFWDFGLHILLKGAIKWVVNNITRIFATRREELRHQRAGAVSSRGSEPRLIWVKMIPRPTDSRRISKLKSFMLLAWKFNNLLEEVVALDRHSHIMSIQLPADDFNISGDLTSQGRYDYWMDFLSQFRKFDKAEIDLRARINNPKLAYSFDKHHHFRH